MSTKTSPLNVLGGPGGGGGGGGGGGNGGSITPTVAGSASSSAASVSSSSMPAMVKIKKELPSDEIKDFAESTMKELLGWYGFDSVDRLDLSSKTSKLLQSAAAAAAVAAAQASASATVNVNSGAQQHQQQQHHHHHHHIDKRLSRSRTRSLLQLQHEQQQHQQQQQQQATNEYIRTRSTANNNINTNTTNNNNINRKGAINCSSYRNNNNNNNNNNSHENNNLAIIGGGGGNESTTSDHDTHSSREDDSKSPHMMSRSTGIEEKIDLQNCCWCRRPIPENAPEFLTTSDAPRYCSESCFTQSRRASFKKAKTCDWCKHVRHAVSYVDFQDGASQLQFCSDKCLNQYKMQIFCKETQAHLDMNPHLRDQAALEAAAAGGSGGLITPDLWLRNCRSRSASPASTISISPGPPPSMVGGAGASSSLALSSSSPRVSPSVASGLPAACTSVAPVVAAIAPSSASASAHKPIISVAPVSKLMSKSPGIMQNRQSPKHNRKKRPVRSGAPSSLTAGGDLTVGGGNGGGGGLSGLKSSMGGGAPLSAKSKGLLGTTAAMNGGNVRSSPGQVSCKSTAASLSQFAAASVQDLHMSVPPLSPMLDNPPTLAHTLPVHAAATRGGTSIPTAFFATPTGGVPPPPPPSTPPTPPQTSSASVGFHSRLPPPPQPPHGFLPNPIAGLPPGLLPRFLAGFSPASGLHHHHHQLPPPPPPPPTHFMHPEMSGLAALMVGSPTPPVTVMVPYPIVIPLPIPIPVPLPVIDFYRAYLRPEERERHRKEQEEKKQLAESMEKSEATTLSEAASPAASVSSSGKAAVDTSDSIEGPLDFTKSRDQTPDDEVFPIVQTSTTNPDHNDDSLSDGGLSPSAQSQSPMAGGSHGQNFTTENSYSSAMTRESHGSEMEPPIEDAVDVYRTSANDDTKAGLAHYNRRMENDTAVDSKDGAGGAGGGDDVKDELPKLKITRLQTKRTLIQTKESESSRPLRKRKRIIDCDFQKMALKGAESEGEVEADAEVDADADMETVPSAQDPYDTTAVDCSNSK